MSRTIATVSLALLLLMAGCTGAGSPTPDSAQPTAQPTAEPTTTEPAPETPATYTTEAAFQTGNQSASLSKAIDGDSFVLYYGDHHAKARVELAAVTVPPWNESDIDPATYHYDDAATDDERSAQRLALKEVAGNAIRAARTALSGPAGDEITVVHTGETTSEGVPLVYIYFDWDGRWTIYNEYVAGSGFGVLTTPDSPHAEQIASAQAWAKDNDEGLWEHNEADEET